MRALDVSSQAFEVVSAMMTAASEYDLDAVEQASADLDALDADALGVDSADCRAKAQS